MRTAPINLRAMPNQRDLIDQAAAILGKTRSDFMLEVACAYAKEVILDQTLFQLEPDKFNQFITVLETPVENNEGLSRLLATASPWDTRE